jgi:hypothetical protein
MIWAGVIMAVGAFCIGLFVHLILNVQPRWFPGQVEARPGKGLSQGLPRMSRTVFGLIVGTVLFVGIALFSLGSAVIATTIGYGHI